MTLQTGRIDEAEGTGDGVTRAPNAPLGRAGQAQATRARILAAARVAFARDGYERATIRGIAQAASINPALVIRYYESKEQLFACVASFSLAAEPLVGVPREVFGEALVSHVLGRWEHPETGPALAAMLRASISRAPVRQKVSALLASELDRLLGTLGIAAKTDTAPLIAAEILGLVLSRHVLKLPAVVELPRATIVRRMGQVVQQQLDAARAELARRGSADGPGAGTSAAIEM
jgi:AcrR family transcriptional regulator